MAGQRWRRRRRPLRQRQPRSRPTLRALQPNHRPRVEQQRAPRPGKGKRSGQVADNRRRPQSRRRRRQNILRRFHHGLLLLQCPRPLLALAFLVLSSPLRFLLRQRRHARGLRFREQRRLSLLLPRARHVHERAGVRRGAFSVPYRHVGRVVDVIALFTATPTRTIHRHSSRRLDSTIDATNPWWPTGKLIDGRSHHGRSGGAHPPPHAAVSEASVRSTTTLRGGNFRQRGDTTTVSISINRDLGQNVAADARPWGQHSHRWYRSTRRQCCCRCRDCRRHRCFRSSLRWQRRRRRRPLGRRPRSRCRVGDKRGQAPDKRCHFLAGPAAKCLGDEQRADGCSNGAVRRGRPQ